MSSSVATYYDSDGDVHGTRPGVWAATKPNNPGKDTSVDVDDREHF